MTALLVDSLPLRAAAAAAFLAVLAAICRPPAPSTASHTPSFPGRGPGLPFWLVVTAEAAALAAGLALLNGPLHAPHAGVAWVSTVVGAHFFALAGFFRQRFFHRPGSAIMACGVMGVVLAAGGAPVPLVSTISGIVPGALLLASGWWGAHQTAPTTAPATSR